jgi:hypothetical protein
MLGVSEEIRAKCFFLDASTISSELSEHYSLLTQ